MLKKFSDSEATQLFIYALFLFLLLKMVLVVSALLAMAHPQNLYLILVHCYLQFDARYYLSLAQFGYVGPYYQHPYHLFNVYYANVHQAPFLSAFAFFPMYPWLISLVHYLFHLSYELSGFLIAQVACVLTFYFLGLLIRCEFNFALAKLVMTIFALFPMSFYLVSIYTESLFLAFALAGVYAASCGRFYLAGFLILAATFTRNTGILLELFLLAYYVQYKGFNLKFWRNVWWHEHYQMFSLLLAPLGFLSYMLWLKIHFGDALLFMHVQTSDWHRHFSPIWNNYYQIAVKVFSLNAGPADLFEFVVVNFLLLALISGFLRLRRNSLVSWVWWFYLLLMILMTCTQPAFNDYFLSVPRFTLMMFPAFVYWAYLLQDYFWYLLWLLGSIILLIFYSVYFFIGGWVA